MLKWIAEAKAAPSTEKASWSEARLVPICDAASAMAPPICVATWSKDCANPALTCADTAAEISSPTRLITSSITDCKYGARLLFT